MSLYKNKYRVESTRLPGWDYSSNGMYFITIVTQHRACNLGEIVAENIPVMKLTGFGKIVDTEWKKSFEIRNELFLDEYIIMPNHLHAIVIINNNESMTMDKTVVDESDNVVETHGRASLQSQPISQSQPFHRLPKSISSFLAGFKSAVNTKIDDYIDKNDLNIPKYNRNNHFFQSNYHDHIIRSEIELYRIRQYIKNNAQSWIFDSLNNQGGISNEQ